MLVCKAVVQSRPPRHRHPIIDQHSIPDFSNELGKQSFQNEFLNQCRRKEERGKKKQGLGAFGRRHPGFNQALGQKKKGVKMLWKCGAGLCSASVMALTSLTQCYNAWRIKVIKVPIIYLPLLRVKSARPAALRPFIDFLTAIRARSLKTRGHRALACVCVCECFNNFPCWYNSNASDV